MRYTAAQEDDLMKKTALAFAAAITALCAASTGYADTYSFTDISADQYSWCAPYIEDMYKAGYVNGYEDNTYRPDNQVTKLEGIALFARAMGSSDPVNETVLELAHDQYDSALSTCSLSWGDDELAYMMYKGALTAADLTTYISGTTKNEPLTRGEAAVIITKAMGGEVSDTSSDGVSLSYNDAGKIPVNILQYVKYVSDEGIMNGMDDGSFSADGTVTRSQIAVMLSRAVEKCDYSFYKARINAIDEEEATITLDITDIGEKTYDVTDTTDCYIRGAIASISDMPENVTAVVQFSGDNPVSIDAMSEVPDEQIVAIYSGYNTVGSIIQIKVKEKTSSDTVTAYNCIADVPITYAGSPATIKSFKSGDTVTLEIADGVVQAISGGEKSETISNATITDMEIGDTDLNITISSADSNYDGKTYPVSSDVRVQKNNKDADMSEIYVGDKVTLTVEYGTVVKVTATSSVTTVSGTLTELTISNQPSITLSVDGKEKTYQIPQDCTVLINEEEGSLYDFRVGDSLVLTVESQAVTKIKCSTSVVSTSGRVNGVVSAVNSSYGFISVTSEDSTIPITVFCSNTKTTFIDEKGGTVKMNDISVGDTIECRGATSNGAFVATLIIVTPTSN